MLTPKTESCTHVIVASEPSTYNSKEWDLIEKNHCLMVETDGKAQLEKLEYPLECKLCLRSIFDPVLTPSDHFRPQSVP